MKQHPCYVTHVGVLFVFELFFSEVKTRQGWKQKNVKIVETQREGKTGKWKRKEFGNIYYFA